MSIPCSRRRVARAVAAGVCRPGTGHAPYGAPPHSPHTRRAVEDGPRTPPRWLGPDTSTRGDRVRHFYKRMEDETLLQEDGG